MLTEQRQSQTNVEIKIKNIKMKTTIKLFIFTTICSFYSCSAQTIATLQQMEECRKRPNKNEEDCPGMENIKFVKDIGNRLDKFVGTWTGNDNGKSYELKLEKKVDFGEYDVKWDQLIGKIRIKDNQGNILYDTFSDPEIDANPFGVNFQGSTYEMHFGGNFDCGETGNVFMDILPNPSDGSKLRFFYTSNAEGHDPVKCPNYSSFVPLLPLDWTTLTKQ